MVKKVKTLEEKMRLAQAGDQRVYAELLTEMTRIIRAYLQRKVSSSGDLEDVVQEVLVSVHRARHTYDGSRPLKPWVLAIATYRFNDYLRKYYRKSDHEVTDYDSLAYQLAENVTGDGDDNELVYKALEALPERQREVVYLLKIEGYSVKEVSEQVGMSVSAVKVTAHRAYKRLKKELKEIGYENG